MPLKRRRPAAAAAFGLLLAALSISGAHAQRSTPAGPPAVTAEFRQFLAGFRQALRANDAGGVAALTRLPMHFDDAPRDRAYFESRIYRQLFTARNRTCLQTARPVYQRDGEGTDTFSMFCGDMYFLFSKTPAGFRFTDNGPND